MRLLSAPSLTLKVTDGESTRVVEMGSLCAPRTLRVVTPADGLLRPGEPLELQWEPATDTLAPMHLIFQEEGGPWLAQAAPDLLGTRLTLTAPPRPSTSKPVVLWPTTALGTPDPAFKVPVNRCDFDRCDMQCGASVPIQSLPVQWAP